MRIQHYLTADWSSTPVDQQSNAEFWGEILYMVTVGWWGFWAIAIPFSLAFALAITHDERKRRRHIRDLARQGNFYEASIASAQNERAFYEEGLGIAGGLALGAMGNENKDHRNQTLMMSGAGAIYNERQLEHFDSIDFEDHRRRHEAHLRKKYSAPQERPARLSPTVTIVRSCLNSECRRRLRSTGQRSSRQVIRCPECGREQWHNYP